MEECPELHKEIEVEGRGLATFRNWTGLVIG